MTTPIGYTVLCHSDAEFRDAVTRELQKLAALDATPTDAAPTCQDCPRPAATGGLCRVCSSNADANHREYDNPVTRFGA